MKLKENWKRFWNLTARHDGFTLVELIVVIAILAILAGVAVPAYSGYITQANKSNDETLASEIKNALMLGYYNGTLKPGASVIVYYDGTAVKVEGEGADQAMKDAFGENYATSLKLSWDGWEMGTAADSVSMGYVNGSSFDRENLGTLLSQVDTVVSAATTFLANKGTLDADAEQWKYLEAAGISVPDNKITDANASAIANATVFVVADHIANTVDLTTAENASNLCAMWFEGFESMGDKGWDFASIQAANYASTVALTAYIDNYTKTNYPGDSTKWTSYNTDPLLSGTAMDILDNRTSLLGKIAKDRSNNEGVAAALSAYMNNVATDPKNTPCYKDAMAFVAYMHGVTESSSALVNKGNLNTGNYFEGNADFVTNYVSLSDLLISESLTADVLVFYFDGTECVCMPLDYIK